MNEIQFTFKGADELEIFVRKWTPENLPAKAAILIAHGMGEHSERYRHFAGFLNQNNFIVYANDHRGHGNSAKTNEQLGFFSQKNGWTKLIEDSKILLNIISAENPGLPVVLLGHSMGSFIVRNLISLPDVKVKAAVLSGTTGDPGPIAILGKWIGATLAAFQGKQAKNNFLHQTGFGKFNQQYKPPRTEFDWLSRDNDIVDKYVADPKCGMVMSIGFMLDLTQGLSYINSAIAFANTPKELPLFLCAGDKDPVSANGKGVTEVFDNYSKAGIKNIKIKLYPEARHEILNEINKQEVYQDIVNWINDNLH